MLAIKYKIRFNLSFLSILIVFLSSCAPQKISKNNASTYQHDVMPSPFLVRSCDDINIDWLGKNYRLSEKIGSGASGSVYTLRELNARSDSKEYVVKIISKADESRVYREAIEEVFIFNEFAGFFTPSWYKGFYKINAPNLTFHYHSFVLKKRVNGLTAHSIVIGDNAGVSSKELYDRFIDFKTKLIKHMTFMAENKNVYLWDLHLGNLMYDTEINRWLLVDANRSVGFDQLIGELYRIIASNRRSRFAQFYAQITQLLARNKFSQDENFFEQYLNFYFEPIEESLRLRANPQVTGNSEFEDINLD